MSDDQSNRPNLDAQREKLRRAREAARSAEPRAIEMRDEGEPIGVSAHFEPASRRQEPTRDGYRDEVSADQVAENFVRRRREERTVGSFDIPEHRKKPGWSYQWMTIRVFNQPVDPADIRDFTHNGGWRPVPARDVPEMADTNDAPDAPIEARGQRLYCRPLHLTREAQEEDKQYAIEQQRDKTIAAANGRSAGKGSEGMGDHRGVKRMPLSIEIERLGPAGTEAFR